MKKKKKLKTRTIPARPLPGPIRFTARPLPAGGPAPETRTVTFCDAGLRGVYVPPAGLRPE
jgi:hypothetical protein